MESVSSVSLFDVVGESPPTDVTIHAAGNKRAHLVSGAILDQFGNKTDQVNSGCVDAAGCPDGVDEIITTHTEPGRPLDDGSGWIWRTIRTYVTGSRHPGPLRNETVVAFNATGDPTVTRMTLSGTLALDRHHASQTTGAGFSQAPPHQSIDTSDTESITVFTRTWDTFGNTTAEKGANARCRTIDYDATYGALPIKETNFVGPVDATFPDACGSVELSTSAEHDRGLAALTVIRDIHDEKTIAAYDSFGRRTSLTKPDPTVVGEASIAPSLKIEYFLTTDAKSRPYSILHTMTEDGVRPGDDTPGDNHHLEEWTYIDGFGRPIVTLAEADPDVDGAGFIANGLTEYDNKGAERRKFLPFLSSLPDGDAMKFDLTQVPPSPYGRQRYDAFGRQLERFGLDGSVTLRTVYHALSQDLYDAADIEPGPHQGTYASARQDGHGRPVATVERIHAGNAIEARETRTSYLPTGEPEKIARLRLPTNESVVRWIRYDSQGRMVLNVEPNASSGFTTNVSAELSTIKAWRYAYNDAGDLVGTSDPRGCGVDYHYEGAGRLIGEDYSPCLDTQPPYTQADPAARTGFEVLNHYDEADPDAPGTTDGFACDPSLLKGRLVSVSDLASKTVSCYDGRGRVTFLGRRIASPRAPEAPFIGYAPTWYVQGATYDAADRITVHSTGANVAELMGPVDGQSRVVASYTKRGLVKAVGGSYGSLVAKLAHDADRLTQSIQYGDIAGTTTAFSYDGRRRLSSVQTYRGPPNIWTTSPQPGDSYDGYALYHSGNRDTFPLLLRDQEFTYDSVDNPIEIRDWRLKDEWPEGAKPVTRKFQYDDLYRLTQTDYAYPGGTDGWTESIRSRG